MAHYARTQPDGTWLAGSYVMPVSDWQDIDSKIFRAINGDKGGTWCPSSPIVIDPSAGIGADGLWLTGPLVLAHGGSLTTNNGARIILGPGDWPRLAEGHPGRKRTIITSCGRRQSTPKRSFGYSEAIQSYRSLDIPTIGSKPHSFVLALEVHDGATLVKAELVFRILTPRKSRPAQTPKMRIVRVDRDGRNIVPLQSVASGADADGYVSVAMPITGDAYYAGGAVQKLAYACNQNNVIDVSQYMYYAQVFEEMSEPGSGLTFEQKADVAVVYGSNVAITGNPGGGYVTGDRALLTGQTIAQQNGIWNINTAGPWSRAPDLSLGIQFTPGFLVEKKGTGLYQCVSPVNTSDITLTTDATGTPIQFMRATAESNYQGNAFHAVTCFFENITDMRPQ